MPYSEKKSTDLFEIDILAAAINSALDLDSPELLEAIEKLSWNFLEDNIKSTQDLREVFKNSAMESIEVMKIYRKNIEEKSKLGVYLWEILTKNDENKSWGNSGLPLSDELKEWWENQKKWSKEREEVKS